MGGEGSGRKPSPLKNLGYSGSPPPNGPDTIRLPNLMGIQKAAHQTSAALAAGGVTSVFGRTGAVTAATDDYTWAQINKATSDIADITTKSHASLSSIGTNTHAQIDTHIASTSNPHSVTLAQVGGISASSTDTLTNKTIDLTNNTLTGSVTEFNTALEAADFYTTGGTDVAIADGGTGQSTATAAFDALAPTTTQGDLIYHNGTDNARLAIGTSGLHLTSQGAGQNPVWQAAAGGTAAWNFLGYTELGSAAASIDILNLTTTDYPIVKFYGVIIQPAGAYQPAFRMNGITTGIYDTDYMADNGAPTSADNQTSMALGADVNGRFFCEGFIFNDASTGQDREMSWYGHQGGDVIIQGRGDIQTAATISGMALISVGSGSNFGTGSFLAVYGLSSS